MNLEEMSVELELKRKETRILNQQITELLRRYSELEAEIKRLKGILENGCRTADRQCIYQYENEKLKQQAANGQKAVEAMEKLLKLNPLFYGLLVKEILDAYQQSKEAVCKSEK